MAVYSPKREGLTGVFAGGVHWPNGFSVRDVDEKRVPDVRRKQKLEMLKVLAVGEKDVAAAVAREAAAGDALADALTPAKVLEPAAPPPGTGPRRLPPKDPPPPPADVQLPSLAQYIADGNTKGLNAADSKAHYELYVESTYAEAKKTGAKVLEPAASK